MRDKTTWLPHPTLKAFGNAVYIKHFIAPFVGTMLAPDSAFTIPAFVRLNAKRYYGFVTPLDGMALTQDHEGLEFVLLTSERDRLAKARHTLQEHKTPLRFRG